MLRQNGMFAPRRGNTTETNPPKETNAKCHVLTMKRQWASVVNEPNRKQTKKKINCLRQEEKNEYCIKTNIKTDDKAVYKKK